MNYILICNSDGVSGISAETEKKDLESFQYPHFICNVEVINKSLYEEIKNNISIYSDEKSVLYYDSYIKEPFPSNEVLSDLVQRFRVKIKQCSRNNSVLTNMNPKLYYVVYLSENC